MAFADDFEPGWISEDLARTIAAPLLGACQVRYSIWQDGQVMEYEPSSRESISLCCEGSAETGINSHHEAAWRHFEAHSEDYERALREVLWRLALRNFEQAEAESDGEDEFRAISRKADFRSPESLDEQICLRDIFLYGSGPEGRGYISFEFATGWDEEHGVSVIMHGAEVEGVSGRSDFTCRGDPTGHIAYCRPPE